MEWTEKVSKSTGKTYWYNERTKESTWTRPVSVHYDRRGCVDERSRESSPTLEFRNNQNLFKRYLIDRTVPKKEARLLDLGCGQGGDLSKCAEVHVAYYMGIDVSEASIKFARDRAISLREKRDRYKSSSECIRHFEFFHGDMLDIAGSFPIEKPFDVVLSMFSLHYVIQDRRFKDMICRMLKAGWITSGTTWGMYLPNVKSVPAVNLMGGHIRFDHTMDSSTTIVTITDCLDRCEEPKIDIYDDVIVPMESIGFEVVESGNATDIASQIGLRFSSLDMQDACNLFAWVVFRAHVSMPIPGSDTEPVVWMRPSAETCKDEMIVTKCLLRSLDPVDD